MSDRSTILAANAAFYAALGHGSVEDMASIWAEDDNVSCIHPGWPAIVGRLAVLGSWRDILNSSGRPDIACHDPHPLVAGDAGWVICIEVMGTVVFAASNHFRRVNGVWRLAHHQATPIAASVAEDESIASPGGRLH